MSQKRKTIIVLSAMLLSFLLVVTGQVFAGGQTEEGEDAAGEQAAGTEATAVAGVQGKEAPMLQEVVRQGQLPPLEERLPDNPKVLEVVEEIGQYGGTIRRAFRDPSDWLAYGKFATADGLVRFSPDPKQGFVSGLAEDWQWNADKDELTFFLREGVKWSDGQPFTAEDLAFRFNEIERNEEVPEVPPFTVSGEDVQLEVIDDYTVKFIFPRTHVFALNEHKFRWAHNCISPSHYLKQFHPDYSNAEDWEQFRQKVVEAEAAGFFDVDRPVLQAWKVSNWDVGTRVVSERNPYYWKVDPDGKQLPYVDRIIMNVIKENKIMPLKAINGEIDVQFRHYQFRDFTLLKENESKGDYRVIVTSDARGGPAFYLNWDTPKENLRRYIRQRDFRIALSHAMDREAISHALYNSTQEPQSYTFAKGSEQFDEELFKMYTEHDLAQANRLLDGLGLKDTDGDGVREYPDGEDVQITIWVIVGQSMWVDQAEVVAKQWEKAGIDVVINAIKRSVLYTQCTEPVGPKHDMLIWVTGGSSTPLARSNRWGAIGSLPGGEVAWWQASANRYFHTDGAEGEKPDPGIARIQELWSGAQVETDSAKVEQMAREINRLHAENVYNIGTTTMPAIGVVKSNLRNVPDSFIMGNFSKGLALTRPEQFFFRQ